MAGISAAKVRRESLGLPHTLVDPELSEKRRNAAKQRKAIKKDEVKQRAALTPKGGPISPQGESTRQRVLLAKETRAQDLKRAVAHLTICEAAVDAAQYLVRLVRGIGDCAKAPHAVRRLAAVDLLTMSGVATQNAAGDTKDLTEMTVDELQRQLQHIDQAIEGESHEVPDTNAAPLSVDKPETVKASTRQAFE